MNQRVVVTGVGVCSSLGMDTDTFWTALCAGKSGIRALPDLAPSDRPVVGGAIPDLPPIQFDKPSRHQPDRMIQLAHHAVAEAIQMAQPPLPHDTAVLWGTGYTTISMIEACYESWFLHHKLRADTVPVCMPAAVLPHLCTTFDLHGPSTLISATCASGLQAIGICFDLLRSGVTESALAGCSDAPLTTGMYAAWRPLRVLASDLSDPAAACRPFSVNRTGLVMAEGSAAFVMETLDHAQRRGAPIIAEILSFNAATASGSIVAPDIEHQELTLRRAVQRANIDLDQVDYINAHATATKLGDTAETETIKSVFGDLAYRIPISAIKGATGHAMGASSGLEALATVLTLKHQVIPPTINFTPGDPTCDLDYVADGARHQAVNIAVKESFGFGGSNAVLVLKRWHE
ncbi:MAG: beta-ketoacyl-[acyl-carrier-protein] synthase family protein [Herpetosiphon sp.]|nr:beta-ketoacyl-[acyl-carrier-protein] synthase family protein [Herpetosiphon sp.]